MEGRRGRLPLLLLGASFILAGCGAHSESQNPQQVKLGLALSPGTTYRYLVSTTGTMQSSQPGIAMTVTMDVSMRQTYQVVSVDSAGVATVKVTIDQMQGKMGSTTMPIPSVMPAFTVQIARDGTVTGMGSDQYGSMLAGLPFANPAPLGGITPSLPAGSVKPGDRWTKTSTIPGPAGESAGQITWNNQLLRFDSLNGERVAVIHSDFKAPMDTTIDSSKLAQTFPSALPSGMPTPPPGFSPPPGYSPPAGASGFPFGTGFNPVIHLQGTTTGTMTSWVDVSTGLLRKSSGTSDATLAESVQGLPSAPPGGMSFGSANSQMTEKQSITVSPLS